MTRRQVGVGFTFEDHTTPVAGDEGATALQSQSKLVTRPGSTQAVADIDINDFDLTSGNFSTGEIDIGGTASLSIAIESQQSNTFEVQVDLYDDNGDVLRTVDSNNYSDLSGTDITVVTPVFSDRVDIIVTDTSGQANNDIDGSINANTGGPTTIDAQLQNSAVIVQGQDGDDIEDSALNSAINDADVGLVTYLARALNSRSLDEFVTRVTNSSGTQIDPLTTDVTQSQSNDELRTRLLGVDDGNSLREAQVEQLDTAVSNTLVAQLVYGDRALQSVSQDQYRVDLQNNNAGTINVGPVNEADERVDPDSADAAYANGVTLSGNGEVTRTLVARGGDDLVGRVESTGQYDVEIRYQDDNGNTIFTETVASNVTGGTVTALGPSDTVVDPASDHIVVAILDDSGANQTVSAVLHYN